MERRFDAHVKTEEELKTLQLKGLQWTVNHVYNGSVHYKKKFDEARVKPGDIKTLDDIRKLPFTTSKDLQEGYPFPLQSVPFEKIVRIHASSGTTGTTRATCGSPVRPAYGGTRTGRRPAARGGGSRSPPSLPPPHGGNGRRGACSAGSQLHFPGRRCRTGRRRARSAVGRRDCSLGHRV